MLKEEQLATYLRQVPQAPYPCHSRMHALRTFAFPHAQCFVKREDELGFGIAGSKIRKYRTLIPFLLNQRIEEVLVIGSAYSNHVLSLVQLLIENGLRPTLFLRGDPNREVKGNALLTSLFVPSSSIHWFSKQEWPFVEQHAQSCALKCSHSTFIVPEGACLKEAFPGALTLPLDILKNEQEAGFCFDHLFMDSGTGLTAIAVILAFSWLQKLTRIHVWLMAEDRSYFLAKLNYFYQIFQESLKDFAMPFPANFELHFPTKARRFGETNPSVFQDIADIARGEGFLTDPVYSSKLLYEAKQHILRHALTGHLLLIHSGGALTLMGFEEQLRMISQEIETQRG